MTEQLDAKWHVPRDVDITERAVTLPPPAALLPTAPMLGILSVRALEDQATGTGLFALVAWQAIAGAGAIAAQTLDQLAHTSELSGIELLMLGHTYVATGAGDGAAFEVAQRARKILKQPVTPQSIDASLMLAVTALPYGAERVRTLLDMLEPELAQGTDEHFAVHALIRAAADPSPALLDDAYTRLATLDDAFGLAQCAHLAYAQELATTKRPALPGLPRARDLPPRERRSARVGGANDHACARASPRRRSWLRPTRSRTSWHMRPPSRSRHEVSSP
ncbi:MAG: hypothetical protein IPQ07_16155 [Myxococcales bacterium]|nr:hypothetical protein [Myxococcales bacterium]